MRIQRSALCFIVCAACLWLTTLAQAQTDAASPPTAPRTITLEEALALAVRNRPELQGISADLEAARIQLDRAGSPPNPELGVEVDNLGGGLPDDEVRETTISLSQPIELGGKPSARKNKSMAATLRLQHEQTTAWLDIAAEVRMSFLEVLGARERLLLQQEGEQIAGELAVITRERVAAGELAATEETRAEARRAEAAVQTLQAKRLLAGAELDLATVLQSPGPLTVPAHDKLPQEVAAPELATLLVDLQNSPFLELGRSETKLAAAGLSLERSSGWSDPTLSLGVREMPDRDGRAVAIGLSFPLPLFQRNQAGIAEAAATARKAAVNEEATELRLRKELTRAHTALVNAGREAHTLRTEVIARAEEAGAAVQEGFRLGKFRYTDVLEASQSLVTAKISHLETILILNQAAIALDRLLGKPQPAGEIPTTPSNSTDRNSHEL
ncbi:MAG: TolC family protein [Deltaproteobacteria bacterium]|nr:TolC family protein [Deltaproteobacteria bacterium]